MIKKPKRPYPLTDESDIPKKIQQWFIDQDQGVFPFWTGKKKQYDEYMADVAFKTENAFKQGLIKNRAYSQTLCLFYHHSAQVAWIKKEREKAREKIIKAVEYQDEEGEKINPYTKFLYFVYSERPEQAKEYAKQFEGTPSHSTFLKLIAFYEIS